MHLMPMQNTPNVADKVRGIAAERRVRQVDIAAALNLSRMAVTRRFNGSVPFSAPELIILSKHLGVPVGAFFGEVAA